MRAVTRFFDYLLKPPALGPYGPLELLILQPTPFCNLDCSYCYLPDRGAKHRMGDEVLEATLKQVFSSGLVDKQFTLVWHAGEPMVVGIPYYDKALEILQRVTPAGVHVIQSFQTNATLIDDAWCEWIRRNDVRVGVSVDGPAFLHDRYRKTRSGRGTHDRVLQGMQKLREHGIPFSVICVLTRDSLAYPEEIFRFFMEQSVQDIGFNVEEKEGVHTSSSLEEADCRLLVTQFFSRLHDLNRASGDPLRVRELARTRNAVFGWSPLGDKLLRFHGTQEASAFKIITVDWQGNFSTFSPEMLGLDVPAFGRLDFGNVLRDTFEDAIRLPKFREVARAVQRGVARCEKECRYFSFCGGGSPANKAFENGGFDSTETMRCRLHVQAVTDVVLEKLETELADSGSLCPA